MANVAHATKTTPAITCHGCGNPAKEGCRCLSERAIMDRALEAAHRLLEKGTDPARSVGSRANSRTLARSRLRNCLELREQAERESAAFRAFRKALIRRAPTGYSARRDAQMLEFMMGDYFGGWYATGFNSVEFAAGAFRRPVAYVAALRDQLLRALEHWPVEGATITPISVKRTKRAEPSKAIASRRAA